MWSWDFPGGWLSSKESPANAGDAGSIPGSGKSPGENKVLINELQVFFGKLNTRDSSVVKRS